MWFQLANLIVQGLVVCACMFIYVYMILDYMIDTKLKEKEKRDGKQVKGSKDLVKSSVVDLSRNGGNGKSKQGES